MPQSQLNLPYRNSSHYWICVIVSGFSEGAELEKALASRGMRKMPEGSLAYIVQAKEPWTEAWQPIRQILEKYNAITQTEVAVIPDSTEPGLKDIALNRKSADAIDAIAGSLWLADAIVENRLLCYMQPIMDRRGKCFGFEAFARLQSKTGEIIGGGKIIAASRDLNIERLLDRQLHALAIKTFVGGGLEGFLFVNFEPGFIMRPEKYLEGLAAATQETGMPPKNIVLDITHAESPHDALHLRAVIDYCRQKGYSIALDDIHSVQAAMRLLDATHPDFLKLDMGLVKNALKPLDYHTIRGLIDLAHEKGCMVIAEGVENAEIHKAMQDAGSDLFQGYHFAAPFDATKRLAS